MNTYPVLLLLVFCLMQLSHCSPKSEDASKETSQSVTDIALQSQESEARSCPNCVSGECATNAVVSGLPIVQLIAAGIVGFIWAAIFIWLYASFYSTSYSYGPSPGYGYGMSPSPAYGTPNNQYGAPPLSTYNAPAPVYSAPAPAYMAPDTTYQAPAPVYMAPAPAYMAPAPAYMAPAPVYMAPAPSSYTAPAPSQQYNTADVSTALKPPSRRFSNKSRHLDLISAEVNRALNSTNYR